MSSMDGLRTGAGQSGNNNKGKVRSGFRALLKLPKLTKELLAGMTPDETAGKQIAEPVVLLAGDYEDVYQDPGPDGKRPRGEGFRFREHTFPVMVKPKNGMPYRAFKKLICSCGPNPHAPQPCLGCYYVENGFKDSNPKDMWMFSAVHLGWYHQVPFAKDGQIQYKQGTNEPIMLREECMTHKPSNLVQARLDRYNPQNPKARPCSGCQQNATYVWGDQRTIQVGKKHLGNLLDLNSEFQKRCANCGTFLRTLGYACPSCSTMLYNLENTSMTNKEIEMISKSPVRCQCGYTGIPVPEYDCGYDERGMQTAHRCPDNVTPRPLSIFDVVLWVQREGESTDSEVIMRGWEPISTYKTPDGRPLQDHIKEIAPQQYNLEEMYKPQSLDEQAKVIDQKNVYAQQMAPATYTYGQAQQMQVPLQMPAGMPALPQQQPMQPQPYPNVPQPGRPNWGGR